MVAYKTCQVESCARFTVTQWVIGFATGAMLLTQGYLINRIEKIEDVLGDKITGIDMAFVDHKVETTDIKIRLAIIEKEIE